MGISDPRLCFDCKKYLKNWVEFQLVDEQDKPLASSAQVRLSVSYRSSA
ncbi:hypothetical protein ACSLVK_22170 [Photorhabdus tasmaniensis]|nr:hypothetical protein [Photorhabdus tasmaniensis]